MLSYDSKLREKNQLSQKGEIKFSPNERFYHDLVQRRSKIRITVELMWHHFWKGDIFSTIYIKVNNRSLNRILNGTLGIKNKKNA